MLILAVMMTAYLAVLFLPFWWVVDKALVGAENFQEVKSRAVPLLVFTVILLGFMLAGGAAIEWITTRATFRAIF